MPTSNCPPPVADAAAEPMPTAALDPELAAAVEVAHAAAVEEAGGDPIGAHVGVEPEHGGAATHLFEATVPGYRGWRWAVTVANAGAGEAVTISEVVLLPGPDALTAPSWVPWQDRVQAGDLGVGDLLPTEAGDARLVPAYQAADDDEADAEIATDIGLGRVRVMSRIGRFDAADRWQGGDYGPDSDMARSAPDHCGTCGFYLAVAGSMRAAFGVCGNEFSPADGRVVHVEYGCGAHSEVELDTSSPVPVSELVYDDTTLDVEPAEPAATEPPAAEVVTEEPPAGEAVTEEPPASEAPAAEPPAEEPPVAEAVSEEPPVAEVVTEEPPAAEPVSAEPPAAEAVTEEPPASEPPAEPPVAEAVSEKPPASEPPAAEAVTNEPPAAEPLAVEPLAVEPPVAEAVAEEPLAAEAVTEEPPANEPPAAEPPVAEPLAAEAPVAEAPVAEAVSEEPPAEEPGEEEPAAEQPAVDE